MGIITGCDAHACRLAGNPPYLSADALLAQQLTPIAKVVWQARTLGAEIQKVTPSAARPYAAQISRNLALALVVVPWVVRQGEPAVYSCTVDGGNTPRRGGDADSDGGWRVGILIQMAGTYPRWRARFSCLFARGLGVKRAIGMIGRALITLIECALIAPSFGSKFSPHARAEALSSS